MATDPNTNKRINHEKLTRFVQAAFEKLGVAAGDAQIAAEALVAADLRGVDTHGVIRFSPHAWYVKWLSEGSMTAKPNIRVTSETPSTALLDGASLSIGPSERLCLVGRNGSGKSTLLKLVSGILKPTSGSIAVNGRIAALIELGAGFHPEITGRENIYINGIMLGLARRDIDERFDRIVEFSGIGEFLDQPVKTYSSGMYVRLGFAVAVHVDPDVLLIDEVLSVGDEEFQRKCLGTLRAAYDILGLKG